MFTFLVHLIHNNQHKNLSNKKNIVVWQLAVIPFHNKTLIRGVLLKTNSSTYKKPSHWFNNLLQIIQSYFKKVDSNRLITISTDKKSITTETREDGSFSVLTDFLINRIDIFIKGNNQPLEIIQDYPVFFKNTPSNFDVISDIDDTIIISHTANLFKRISTLALITPKKRKTIAFTEKVLKYLDENKARVHYVSKSEYNLFGLLSSFITYKEIPKGPLLLTPYLSFLQLLHSKKGYDFKLNEIRLILKNSKNKQFILLGDDTQKDMQVYTKVINEFPNRIIKVYIRQTRSKKLLQQKTDWENLKSTGVSTTYFNDDTPFNQQEIINLLKK